MNSLKCIIVDDDQGSHLVTKHYINKVKTLSLIGHFYDPIEALDFINNNKVDLIFLDINMPGISGLEMLETLLIKPYIIITSAYKDYALESYKYEVIDYLVKPFELKAFISAVNKVINRLHFSKKSLDTSEINYINIKVDSDYIMVNFTDILYIQSYGNYVKIFTKEKMLLTQSTTNEITNRLDENLFVRIHKSYIIALKHISKISGRQAIMNNGVALPIGSTFKRDLLKHLN